MTEVLYIGPYKQNDGWGQLSRGVVDSLIKLGVKLVLRPIWFTDSHQVVTNPAHENYENNQVTEYNVVIQHGLPHALAYDGKFDKNIALTSVDSEISNTSWVTTLNLFDVVLTFSDYEEDLLIESGVNNTKSLNNPPFGIPIGFNNLNINIEGVKIYAVGSTDMRSGTYELLTSFLSSYSIYDQVHLILATNQSEDLEKMVMQIKQHLGKYDNTNYYPNVMIINSTAPEVMNYLHSVGDLYVECGYNSRISENFLKAIYFETCTLAPSYYQVNVDHGFFFETEQKPACVQNKPLPYLYSDTNLDVPVASSLQKQIANFSVEESAEFKSNIGAFIDAPINKLKEAIQCN